MVLTAGMIILRQGRRDRRERHTAARPDESRTLYIGGGRQLVFERGIDVSLDSTNMIVVFGPRGFRTTILVRELWELTPQTPRVVSEETNCHDLD
jgi:hypothetical protein